MPVGIQPMPPGFFQQQHATQLRDIIEAILYPLFDSTKSIASFKGMPSNPVIIFNIIILLLIL